MTRYIIQDAYTGFIWGDTADFAVGRHFDEITEACEALDQSLGTYDRTYEEVYGGLRSDTGYIVYRADVDNSEAVPIVQDGQDQETIDAVEHSCVVAGYVTYHTAY